MASVRPFRAVRPKPSLAEQIAAVPYDVVSTDEARALADGNPLSFLRVSRAEIELPPGVDPYADAVYERARPTSRRSESRPFSSRTSRGSMSIGFVVAAPTRQALPPPSRSANTGTM
jgi:uncharacterized protein (DUF1015 family)